MNRLSRQPPARLAAVVALWLGLPVGAGAARPDGELELRVVDAASGAPLPARIHLRDARRRPVRTRTLGLAHHGDHFYIDGAATLGLRRGQYRFDLDAGWERPTHSGHFEISRRAADSKTIETKRATDLARQDWYGADVDAARPLVDLGVVLRAEGLAYAPITGWTNRGGAWKPTPRTGASRRDLPESIGVHSARVELADGALLFVRTDPPVLPDELPAADAVTVEALQATRDAGYRVVAADIASWRLPIWIAAGVIDSVAVIDRASLYSGVDTRASRGRPAPRVRYPGALGPGRWREAIYFHLLSAGLRMPAVAGSGSGDADSPLGTNRVYAYCPAGFSPAAWWDAVDAGQTVVTNGPLLTPSVFGEAPGFVFPLAEEETFNAAIALNLSTRQPVEYLELIQNGESVVSVSLRDWAANEGRLPELSFDAGGWFAVRAVTTTTDRYQMALTGPYYVERPGEPRISRASCQFFLDWLDAYRGEGRASDSKQAAQAREYWRSRLDRATAP